MAFSPLSGRPEPLEKELVKIAGKGKGWSLLFLRHRESSCTIYSHRPLECRLLKCWDTEQLLSVIGKDTLARADILSEDDPVMKYIETHETGMFSQMAEDLISVLLEKNDDPESLAKLTALVHRRPGHTLTGHI